MSQENIDALRPVYAEWSRGNWRPVFEVYALESVGLTPRGTPLEK